MREKWLDSPPPPPGQWWHEFLAYGVYFYSKKITHSVKLVLKAGNLGFLFLPYSFVVVENQCTLGFWFLLIWKCCPRTSCQLFWRQNHLAQKYSAALTAITLSIPRLLLSDVELETAADSNMPQNTKYFFLSFLFFLNCRPSICRWRLYVAAFSLWRLQAISVIPRRPRFRIVQASKGAARGSLGRSFSPLNTFPYVLSTTFKKQTDYDHSRVLWL